MMKFELILENKKRGYYHNLALFIIVLNIAVFAILAFYTTENGVFWKCISAFMAIAVIFALEWFLKKQQITFNAANAALLYIAFNWIILSYWWAAAVSILLWLFYDVSRRQLLVSFSEKGIVYPSFPRRNLQWNELTNTILKDDLLTIDFKNNRIVQQLIEKTAKPVDEKEFNDFCRMQLKNT